MNNNFNQNQPMGMMPGQMPMYPQRPLPITAIVGYVSSLLLFIAVFLNSISTKVVSTGTEDGVTFLKSSSAYGAILLTLAISSALLIFAKKNMATIFTSVGTLSIVIQILVLIGEEESTYVKYSAGAGVWVALVGAIGLLVHCFLYWREHPECLEGIINLRPRMPMGMPMNGPMPMNNGPMPMNNNNR